MMSVVLSTLSLSPSERADYWQSVVSGTFIPLDVMLHEREPSVGTITTDTLGPLQISEVEAGPQTVSRHGPWISRGGGEYLTVTLQHRGIGRLTQDGRQALVRPGTFTCSDAGRPYRREQPDDFRFTAIRVPKKVLSVSDSDLRAITGTVFDSRCGTSGVVAGHLERLADRAAGFDPYTGWQLAMTATDLLTVLVRERQGLLNPQASEVARGMLARIKEYILRHLADPDLSPKRIACAHHISVRYLHKLFQSEGTTVGRWIHRERLDRCRRELSRKSRTVPTVSAVAHRWGFANPSHFSRAFRSAYGMSPREWQSSACHATISPLAHDAEQPPSSALDLERVAVGPEPNLRNVRDRLTKTQGRTLASLSHNRLTRSFCAGLTPPAQPEWPGDPARPGVGAVLLESVEPEPRT